MLCDSQPSSFTLQSYLNQARCQQTVTPPCGGQCLAVLKCIHKNVMSTLWAIKYSLSKTPTRTKVWATLLWELAQLHVHFAHSCAWRRHLVLQRPTNRPSLPSTQSPTSCAASHMRQENLISDQILFSAHIDSAIRNRSWLFPKAV